MIPPTQLSPSPALLVRLGRWSCAREIGEFRENVFSGLASGQVLEHEANRASPLDLQTGTLGEQSLGRSRSHFGCSHTLFSSLVSLHFVE